MDSTEILIPNNPLLPSQSETKPAAELPQNNCNKLSPWKTTTQVPEPVSFAEVMSEELAHSLAKEEILKSEEPLQPFDPDEPIFSEDPDCSNDHVLAQLLQMEFDKEHDAKLRLEEQKFNKDSKVSISFDKYKRLPDLQDSDDDDFDYDVKEHWDTFEKAQKSAPIVGKSGFCKQGNVITTKHDSTICGRKNACRVMEFPPGISTGDGGGFDMKLSNQVYNTLKVHSIHEERRAQRLHDKKEKSTAEQTLDPNTKLLLYKLVNRDILEGVNGVISTGKEACVFHALGGKTDEFNVPSECAIKVFKTTLNEFKNRADYIKDDFRFKDRFKKQNPRKVIHMWAEKEMHNLKRIRSAGIPCPEVVILKKHILVMTFIGNDSKPAPKLKEAKLNPQEMLDAYHQTINILKTMYDECQLVHADFSEYNLLWHNKHIYVIDVSQSVERMHPHALEFLIRDCTNVSQFFKKQGLQNISSPKEIFTNVCGLNLPGEGAELLSQIQNYERDEELLAHEHYSKKGDMFDVLFAKAQENKAFLGNELKPGQQQHLQPSGMASSI